MNQNKFNKIKIIQKANFLFQFNKIQPDESYTYTYKFSKNAENATYYGLEFAKRKGCEIILLNVCHFIYHSTSRLDSALAQIEQYSKKMIRSTISKIKEKGEYSDVPVKGINMLGNFSISVSEISKSTKPG